MATVTKKNVSNERSHSGPNGNAWKQVFSFETNSSGVFVASDKATAVADGDVVRIGYLPAGLELHDALAVVSDAFAASTTAKIGFAYADGVDSTDAPQDDDYFFASLNTAAAGRTRAANTGVKPVRLAKDAYLILTRGGAADSAVGRLDVIVEGELKGAA